MMDGLLIPPDRAVVFADLDGVGNTEAWRAERKRMAKRASPWLGDASWLDHALVARLDRICLATGAAVVISSQWRVSTGMPRTVAALRATGLTADIVGATPVIQAPLGAFERTSMRGAEIMAWLAVHALVEKWVVLDDNHVDVDPERFVRTQGDVGLTDALVDRAVAILRGAT